MIDAKEKARRAFLIAADERKSVAEVLAERLCTVEAERDAALHEARQWKLHADWGKTYWECLKDLDRALKLEKARSDALEAELRVLRAGR